MRNASRAAAIVLLAALALGGIGCSRLSARTAPPPPPLDVPPPPPRLVDATDAGVPPPGTLVEPPASAAPSSRRPPAKVEAPKPEPPKPEPPPATTETPPPQEPPRQPASTLQTTPPEREAALERQVRSNLENAARDLNRVDYGRLNVDAQAQYDEAKRFITRAEESLRAKNLVYALKLAENAAIYAAQLSGR